MDNYKLKRHMKTHISGRGAAVGTINIQIDRYLELDRSWLPQIYRQIGSGYQGLIDRKWVTQIER